MCGKNQTSEDRSSCGSMATRCLHEVADATSIGCFHSLTDVWNVASLRHLLQRTAAVCGSGMGVGGQSFTPASAGGSSCGRRGALSF